MIHQTPSENWATMSFNIESHVCCLKITQFLNWVTSKAEAIYVSFDRMFLKESVELKQV